MRGPTSAAAQPGIVYLTGAGPGDPALLTLRALRLLETATVILHDDLVSPEVLDLANPAAAKTSVGKRCGQPRVTQAEIHAMMIGAARAGGSVLRLKSGDPLIFGRAGEEIEALRRAGIQFEIVPGITSAFSAAALLQTPLTNRTAASRLILATAHHTADKHGITPLWTGSLPDEATLALYMPGRHFRALADDLIRSGVDPETPIAAISRASTPHQKTHIATLATLADEDVGPAPVLLLIGHSIQITPEQLRPQIVHETKSPLPGGRKSRIGSIKPQTKQHDEMHSSPAREVDVSTPDKPFDPAEESSTDPIALFRGWLAEATATEPNDPNAMALATSTPQGHPSVRMVLMKGLDERGFAFYTNAESQKGEELTANPHASALFHWKTQRRQVRVTGPVSNLPAQDSDQYFHSRSRGSQIGAAVSRQSRPLEAREQLEAAATSFAAQYPAEIPRPEYWHGFVILPETIEFWQDGAHRLHDRMLYTRGPAGWTRTRLYP